MPGMKSNATYYALIVLLLEKLVQHIVVTLAFYFNWGNIASTVVISPTILMILGLCISALLIVCLRGLGRKRPWAISLATALALFDILGEFAAQGKTGIELTISFIVAALLLFLSLIY